MNHPDKPKRNDFLFICLIGAAYVGVSIANGRNFVNDKVCDSIKLGLIVTLCVIGYLSEREVFHFTRTKVVFLLAMSFLVVFHVTRLTQSLEVFDPVPLFGRPTLAKRIFETILMIGCICLLIGGVCLSVFEINKARKQLDSDVRFLGVTAEIDRIIRRVDNPEQMMRNILDTALTSFDCDRAFLLYPCDPEAQYWRVPMECVKPEYPGAHALDTDLPMNPELSEFFAAILACDGSLSVDWPEQGCDWDPEGRFGVRSQLSMALKPQEGKPWKFGLHQCSYVRSWTQEEKRLFEAIGSRLTDGLSNLLVLRRLRESEQRNRQILDTMRDCLAIIDSEGTIAHANAAYCHQYRYSLDELVGLNITDVVHRDYHHVYKRFEREVQSTGTFTGETVDVRKDGTTFNAEIRGGAIELEGRMCLLAVIRDVTQRKQAEIVLHDYEAQLRSLASELSLAEERERRRIAVGVHDGIGQELTMTKLALKTIAKSSDRDILQARMAELCTNIDQMLAQVRTLTFELGNPVLYEIGLAAAIESWLDTQFREKNGIAYGLEVDPDLPRIDDELRIVLFRNTRELLTNIVKHAHANKVLVSLQRIDHNVRIIVTDDGVGIENAAPKTVEGRRGGFGLFSMREQLKHLGGTLDIETPHDGGTRISISAPLSNG